MAVSNETLRSPASGGYACNDSVVDFPGSFRLLESTDVAVVLTNSVGAESTIDPSLYTVAPTGGTYPCDSFTITTLTTYASGNSITLVRDMDYTQLTSYPDRGRILPSVQESSFDRATLLIQQNKELIDRCIATPVGDSSFTTASFLSACLSAQTGAEAAETGAVVAQGAAESALATFQANGYHLSEYASLSAAVTAIGATEAELIIDKDDTLASNVTVPSNVSLRFVNGNIITTSTYTLTLNCYINAGSMQIINSTGGTVTGRPLVSVIVPQWFGATADGTTDDTAAIQSAIDLASVSGVGQVFLSGGTYIVGSVSHPDLGAMGIMLKDGVYLRGSGRSSTVLKVKDSAYGGGAFYRAISSAQTPTRLSNSGISDLAVDGNVANQVASVQCSNILLDVAGNILVENVHSYNSNGLGIQLVGSSTAAAPGLNIVSCLVDSCTSIGIQVSQFDGLTITGNVVRNTTDNSIDVYSEDGDATPNGGKFTITGNTCYNGLTGVFPETTQQGVISANSITDCTYGIIINRINGEPKGITVSGNTVWNCSNSGIRITGDSGGVFVTGNSFMQIPDNGVGVKLGEASGNISNISVSNNAFETLGTLSTFVLVQAPAGTASFIQIRDNKVLSNTPQSQWYSTSGTLFKVYAGDWVTNYPTEASIASGATYDIALPASSAGILTIRGEAGGAWESVWSGSFVTNASTSQIVQNSTGFIAPGNMIASVTVNGLNARVTAAASGSGGSLKWRIYEALPSLP